MTNTLFILLSVNMKKIIICILCIVGFTWSIWMCQDVKLPFQGELSSKHPFTKSTGGKEDTTDIWELVDIRETYIEEGKGRRTIIVRLLDIFWLEHGTERENDHKFLNYARAIINMALWLVALIALIMTIYTFYMMFFTENDAWIKKAKWNMIGIFIALGIIWLAWIIVSFIFWWYKENRKDKEKDLFSAPTSFNYENRATNDQIYFTV